MICRRIEYKNFRNIENAVIEPSKDVTVLCGDNGEGKTNALEAIYIFAQGRSFRTAHDKDLIKFGSNYAELKLDFSDKARDYSLLIRYLSNGKRICKRNNVDIRKMSEFIGCFRAVLFCPQHLSLVRDGPSARRIFIDIAISQLKPAYMASLQRYNSILNQRNALIKNYYANSNNFRETIGIWSEQLAGEAAVISAERSKYIDKLNKYTTEFISDMTVKKEKVELIYNKPRKENDYVRLLTDNIDREIKAGSTQYGTHKDDIDITLNDKNARSFASQGQQRSIALSMKLSEGEISRELSGDYPVFLLDDILSELDNNRRLYLTEGLDNRQVIMTSCEPNIKSDSVVSVKNGKYVRK